MPRSPETFQAREPARVLIADDVPENLAVLGSLLSQAGYQVTVAIDGPGALRAASADPSPDLILLDVMMPGLDGHEVLRRLQEDGRTRDIPVVFVTALGEPEDEERGLSLGAVDYLTKPIQPLVTLARVRTQLEARRRRDWLRDQNAALEAEVARRMRDNELTQMVTIRALAHLAETRDPETGNHILRIQAHVAHLATRLSTDPRFAAELTPQVIRLMEQSAPLHDIGKVGIPDHILLKAGPLTPEERTIMRTHAALGAEAIAQAERDIDRPLPFLRLAKEIARWHHECWDGSGYPDGLVGEAIPVSARLVAVADMFDALVSPRVYKKAMPFEQARDLVLAGRGRQFDPAVVDAFMGDFEAFVAIARSLRDEAGHCAEQPAPVT